MKYRPVNGDAFRSVCDSMFWHDAAPAENPGFRNGDVVFCKIDEVWRLFRALRRTRKRIVLVTGDGDKPVSPDLWKQRPVHVAEWFGTNMFVNDPTAHPIPLGLGNANGTVTLHWSEIQSALENPPERDRLLYSNFGTFSNPHVRESLLRWVSQPQQHWITREPHNSSLGKPGYLKQLLSHRFILCPPGNGEDTHRMWEALYCGAVPVVRKSPAMRAFLDLPIVFVEDFQTLTPNFLERQMLNLKTQNLESLDLKFWKNQITDAQKRTQAKGRVPAAECVKSWVSELWRVLKQRP